MTESEGRARIQLLLDKLVGNWYFGAHLEYKWEIFQADDGRWSVEWYIPCYFNIEVIDNDLFHVYHGSDFDCFVVRILNLEDTYDLVMSIHDCDECAHFDDTDNGSKTARPSRETILSACAKIRDMFKGEYGWSDLGYSSDVLDVLTWLEGLK